MTAEISVWSRFDAKGGYAATVIFFLTLMAICTYGFLRETGINCWMAGSGSLLAALLPAIARLSLDGFLSQTVHYMLGPPARLRFLVSRPVTANVRMRLAPVSGTATFPIDFFLTDAQGHLSHGELW